MSQGWAWWCNRYLEAGLEGLADREAIWQKLRDDPPDGHTRWSLSLMARETDISTAQLPRRWSVAGAQPHRVRTFKLSDVPCSSRVNAKSRSGQGGGQDPGVAANPVAQ